MTRKQWEDLEGKLVHVTIENVFHVGEERTIECHIHETDDYFEFRAELEEN